MKFNYFSFILTLIAGFSTLLGFLIILVKVKNQSKLICTSLSFSAGVMIYISLFDLIKESFHIISKSYNNIFTFFIVLFFINIGIILSVAISLLIPQKKDKLYKVGIISMIGIILHNIPEGIITFITGNFNKNMGIKLATAISMHNIPEGIAISIPIYYSCKSKKKAFFYTLISGLSEPIGALIAFLFFKNMVTEFIIGLMYSIVAGIMLYISIYELLNESKKLKLNRLVVMSFILGFVFMGFVIKKI